MTTQTDFLLNGYISDGMIIQQNKAIRFSGKDAPSQTVQVSLNGRVEEGKSTKDGDWIVTFPAMEAGGPYTVSFKGSSNRTVEDVYFGEVWLLGGQSNMELPINRTYDEFKEEIDAADYPLIRQFHVEMAVAFDDAETFLTKGQWKKATQESIQDFSSLGFFYAKELHKKLNVPVGIVHTAVGGTPVEAWMNEETLCSLGDYNEEIDYWKDPDNVKAEVEKDMRVNQSWYEDLNAHDKGLREEWFKEDFDDSSWESVTVPFMFKEHHRLKDFSGAVWFRRAFTLSEEDLKAAHFRLRLGSLINGDETYLNGKKVGGTEYRYPPRKYLLNKADLKIGQNSLVIRLSIDASNGGFIPDLPYQLELDNKAIDLTGEWKYKVGYQKDDIEPMLFLHYKPAVLYKGMLSPLKELAFQGILFYQGESNTKQPVGYKDLMTLMIQDWRSLFKDELPFYYVQLANYLDPAVDEDDLSWAVLRYEQDKVRQSISAAEMVPAYDCGQSNELHPHDKKTLAQRLAHVSLHNEYELGPAYENLEVEKVESHTDRMILSVRGLKGDLLVSEQQPELEIKQEEEWVLVSNFECHGNQLIIPLAQQTGDKHDIESIRYAWRNNPKGFFFDSLTKLPLLPFYYPIN